MTIAAGSHTHQWCQRMAMANAAIMTAHSMAVAKSHRPTLGVERSATDCGSSRSLAVGFIHLPRRDTNETALLSGSQEELKEISYGWGGGSRPRCWWPRYTSRR